MESKKLSNIVIELVRGDIAEIEADVIVNAANDNLWMGSGVAGAIKRAGGIEIEKEAVRKGPIRPGEAVETGAGKLRARYVIHAAVMGQDLVTSAEYIKEATRNSLLLCDSLKMESIAMPALGTGVGGFPVDECAKIMMNEAVSYDKNPGTIKRVIFCLFAQKAYLDFQEIYRKIK